VSCGLAKRSNRSTLLGQDRETGDDTGAPVT
jgi:hypothetical protein